MVEFIIDQVLFFLAIILALFLPGYFLLLAAWRKSEIFSLFEKIIISSALSISIMDILLILTGRSGMAISRLSVIVSIILFSAVCFSIKIYFGKKISVPAQGAEADDETTTSLSSFSGHQFALIILLFFLAILIKTIYLSDAIVPAATDLGHHMYWVKGIVETGSLPHYEKVDIAETDGIYKISQPEPIADFIIGEHLIFAAIALISGKSAVSSFSIIILFLINILSIGALFILAVRLFQSFSWGKNAAIFLLFLSGPLYAISSAQAKFASGGVIGNILGNLLIPLAIYFFWRAIRENKSGFFSAALFLTFILFYTHHLSALIFSFVIIFFVLLLIILNIKNREELTRNMRLWIKLLFSPASLVTIAGTLIFFFLVLAPSYIENSAVDTVVGSPTKSTKQGFSFTQIAYLTGEARMALGIIGAVIALFFLRGNKPLTALLLSWAGIIFLMSWKPSWIHINIPSARIANYLAFPVSILAALAVAWLFNYVKDRQKYFFAPSLLVFFIFLVFVGFALMGGNYDNSSALKTSAAGESLKTFHAGEYLSRKTNLSDIVLKDHNYIASDSWMKTFFMRDYNFPLTRSFFFRYEENKNREHCTLWMISEPETDRAGKCFKGTGTNFVVINPAYDSLQFEKLDNFSKIYSSGSINIYYRNYETE